MKETGTRAIAAQELIGRMPVAINLKESLIYLRGKRVLVTGAGGSIGSELCRQLLYGAVARLYLFGHGENSIFEIDKELHQLQEQGAGVKTMIVPIIGDMQNADYLDWLFGRLKADAVFHTAAYKHVPLMEENPVAALENNVFGTDNLVRACRRHGVRRFVLISTDKAVEPVSVYGASKMLCEKIVQNAAHCEVIRENSVDGKLGEPSHPSVTPPVDFMVVRFANVLGSRGSILPLFQRQIAQGGPLTVTHPGMKRYFMTIPEACSLVLKAGGVGENGNLYLLDMGEPVKIIDMAAQMIRFYGFEPDIDIKIEITGMRRGEKLDEKLVCDDEEAEETHFRKIRRVVKKGGVRHSEPFPLAALLAALRPICIFDKNRAEDYRNKDLLEEVLARYIPTMSKSAD